MGNGNFCVYKHTAPNGKVYIGITSQNPHRRWRDNGSGYKKQKRFYNAILKYGWDNIKHEILYSELTKEEAEQKEIELIAEYKSDNNEFGYNVTSGGDYRIGHPNTIEIRIKISASLKGHTVSSEAKRKISEANKGRTGEKSVLSKPVAQLDMQGNIIAIYYGLSEAARITHIPCSNICKCCNGVRKKAGGYMWRYE